MTAFKGKFYRARERLKRLKEANDEVQNQLKETAHFRRVLAVQNRHLLDVLLLQQRAKGNVLADGECSDDPLSSESEDERLLDTELPSGFLLPTHIEHIVIPPVPSSVQNVQPVEEPKPKEPVIQPIPEPEPPQVKKPSPKKNSTPRKRQTKDTPTTGSSSKKQRTSKQAAQRPFTTQIITKGFLVDRPGFVSDAMIYPLGFKSLIIVSGTGDAFHFEVGELNGFPHVKLSAVNGQWEVLGESFGALVEQIQDESMRNWLRVDDASGLLGAQAQLRMELEENQADDSDEDILTDEDDV